MLGTGRQSQTLRLPTGRTGWWAAALLVAALGLAGCNTTPTLPLPPPVALATAPDEQGFALIRGEARAHAYISVINERTESGVITRANERGKFEARIPAEIGDDLTVRQELDGELSEPYYIAVQPTR